MPNILIVDDHPDGEVAGIARVLRASGVAAKVSHPTDVSETDLRDADLLLVDFEVARGWDQSDLPPANRCANGWALASTLRWQMDLFDQRPTPGLVCLLTAEIGRALLPFNGGPAAAGVISSLNGVEWVFDKNGGESAITQIVCLANSSLEVKSSMSKTQISHLLNLPDEESYWDDLMEAGLPAAELLNWRDGVALFRWMMQRVLPYPTFLIGEPWLSARLGVSRRITRELLLGESPLGRALNEATYKGFLAEFSDTRWWSRKVEVVLWEHTGGRSSSLKAIREAVAGSVGLSASQISEGGLSPVVALNDKFEPDSSIADAADCRRIRPEWWPAYAQDAWARSDSIVDSDVLSGTVIGGSV